MFIKSIIFLDIFVYVTQASNLMPFRLQLERFQLYITIIKAPGFQRNATDWAHARAKQTFQFFNLVGNKLRVSRKNH